MEYNLKNIKQEFKKNGVFYSDNKMAQLLKSYIDTEYSEVYEPTCGNGNLLSVFDDSIAKFGQELNQDQLNIAKSKLNNFHGFCGDTLINPNPEWQTKKFDAIVANPPFSISWYPELISGDDERFNLLPTLPPKSKADYAFIFHILHYLSDTGTAVVLNFPGILYRGNSEGKLRQYLIELNYIDKVIQVAGNSFVDTKIETIILVFKKNKTSNNITFVDKDNCSRIVSYDEIVKNNFCLSVSLYIQEDKPKQIIDIDSINRQLINEQLNNISLNLEKHKILKQLFGNEYNFNMQEYILKIEHILNNYR